MWQRHALVTIMLDHLAAQAERLEARVRLSVVVAGSEGPVSRELVTSRGAHYVSAPNFPLGGKWQKALGKARSLDPDGVLVLGSDNLVNDDLVRCWAAFFELGYDYLGLLDAHQYNAVRRSLIHWPGYQRPKQPGKPNREGEPIGSGRAFSRRLLSRLRGRIWDEGANRGLDWSTTQRLRTVDHQGLRLTQTNGTIRHLGIKVPQAMSPSLHGHASSSPLDPRLLCDWFGQEIGERILALDPRELTRR